MKINLLAGYACRTVLFFCAVQISEAQIALTDQFQNLTFSSPVGLYHAGDGTDRLFVVQQNGRIMVFPNLPSATSPKIFLNIQDSVVSGGELGLLGLAFHPQFSVNRYFYLFYTKSTPLRSRVSRFQVSATNPDSAVRNTELILLEQLAPGQPAFGNHKGGQLAFGPDGYLYIALGDGGSSGDPYNMAQSDTTFLGKILRINIDATENGKNYAIPPGNPYVDSTGKKKEIYAKGLRNPWRFSFDQSTLWAGDVGQGTWEEIDTVMKGKNYGWRYKEGNHLFDTSAGGYSQAVLTDPIYEYSHWPDKCSITGGFVYRGSEIPQLVGKYLYGDYCSGQVFSLDARFPGPPTNTLLVGGAIAISSFGIDKFNEVYVCAINNGKIYKITAQTPAAVTLVSPANGQLNASRTPQMIWNSAAWAASYRLQISTDSTFATTVFDDSTITDTSKHVGPLNSLTKYYWRVRAKNGGGNGPYSVKRNFTTLDDATPPATPSPLFPANASLDQPLSLMLRWTTSAFAVTYHVQLATDSAFGAPMVNDSSLIDTFRTSGLLSYATTYYWRVRAKNASGSSAFSSIWRFTTVNPPPPPDVPILSLPADGALDQPSLLTFVWRAANGALTYRLQVASDGGFSTLVVDDSTLVDTSNFVTSLSNSTSYWWRVQAKNAYGTSAFSASRSFTTSAYSASYHMQKGWNLISLPLVVPDGKLGTLFPNAISPAFRYNPLSSYVVDDSLVTGVGYWLKFADSQHVVLSGVPILEETVDISLGWNMIGSLTNTIQSDSTEQVPPGISNGTFFGYGSSYFQAAALQPSRGYWIKSTSPGKIVIRSNGTIEPVVGEQPIFQKNVPPPEFHEGR